MSLHSDVEALARALGVWWSTGERNADLAGLVVADHDGQLLLKLAVTDASTWEADAWTHVDAPTLALILLGHARGLRVDIGECPACRERGSKRGLAKWEWDAGVGMPAGLREIRRTWDVKLLSGNTEHGRAWVAKRPCQECTIDGEPTGRHLLAWERAILDAMPKVSWVRRGGVDHGPFETPGDPATRTALTVLADQAQAKGDKLGDVLAWWLDGECKSCGGTGGVLDDSLPAVDVHGARASLPNMMRCDACLGARSVLGRHEAYLGEMVQWAALAMTTIPPSSRHARA